MGMEVEAFESMNNFEHVFSYEIPQNRLQLYEHEISCQDDV